jgi:DNA-binding NtrC family response regulator
MQSLSLLARPLPYCTRQNIGGCVKPPVKILVVEDDVELAQAIRERLEGWGYPTEWSGTGKDALQKVRQEKYELILLDIFLPDIKGYVLIPQFKEVWPEIGIITMTGYNSRDLEKEVRKQGVLYYMIKPVNTNDLRKLLDHVAEKRGCSKPGVSRDVSGS